MRWSNLKIKILLLVDGRVCSFLFLIFEVLAKNLRTERTIFLKILELTSYLLILFVILKGYLHSASHPSCIEIQISFDWLTSELGSPFVELFINYCFQSQIPTTESDWTEQKITKLLLIHETLSLIISLLGYIQDAVTLLCFLSRCDGAWRMDGSQPLLTQLDARIKRKWDHKRAVTQIRTMKDNKQWKYCYYVATFWL